MHGFLVCRHRRNSPVKFRAVIFTIASIPCSRLPVETRPTAQSNIVHRRSRRFSSTAQTRREFWSSTRRLCSTEDIASLKTMSRLISQTKDRRATDQTRIEHGFGRRKDWALREFDLHCPLIDFFKESQSQDGMHLESRADDLFGNLFMLERHHSISPYFETRTTEFRRNHPCSIRVSSVAHKLCFIRGSQVVFHPWFTVVFHPWLTNFNNSGMSHSWPRKV